MNLQQRFVKIHSLNGLEMFFHCCKIHKVIARWTDMNHESVTCKRKNF